MSIFAKLFKPQSSKAVSILGQRERTFIMNMISGNDTQYVMPAEQINEGFRKVVWFYAAVRTIYEAAANIPFTLMRDIPGAEDVEVEKHEALRLLDSPNPIHSFRQIRQAVHAFRLITGNAYVHLIRARPEVGAVRQLEILYPQFMEVAASGEALKPKQFFYTRGGVRQEVEFNDVLHWAMFNPSSDLRGMSPIEAAAPSLTSYNAGKKWNNKLLENDARPPGMMKVEGNLNDAQFDTVKKRVRDQIQGAQNAGAPVVLDAGMEWTPFAVSPKDLDWPGLMNMTREEIATALNVPVQILNDQTSQTFANFEQAMIALYQYNVIPAVTVEMELWTRYLLGSDSGLYFKPDFSKIEVLQKAKLADWEKIDKAWEMTPNQKLEAKGLPRSDDPLMDKVYVPSGFMPLEVLGGGPVNDLMPDERPRDEE